MGPQTLNSLRAGDALRVGGLTIVPLEQVHVAVAWDQRRIYADAGKRAVAFVFRDAQGTRAVDEAGGPLDLEDLIERVAGLREML